MASLVQDVWIGREPRLRARRLGTYDEAPVRVLFHLGLEETLEDREVATFLDTLGARVEVVALEPRGQGGSGGRFGPEALDDLRAFAAAVPRRWPDGLPLVLAGHGVGACLCLAVAGDADVKGVVFLGPGARTPAPPFLDSLDLAGRLAALRVPLLAIDPRDAGVASPVGGLGGPESPPSSSDASEASDAGRAKASSDAFRCIGGAADSLRRPEMMAALRAQPLATLVVIPGDRRAALRSPWPEVVATWAAFVATAG